MALKRFIPEQDTYIVSSSEEINFGSDEILELGMTDYGDKPARILIQFPGEQINTYLTEHRLGSGSYTATFHLNLSEAHNLPVSYSLDTYIVSESWSEGIGQSAGWVPGITVTGATWKYRDAELQEWAEEGGSVYESGSQSTFFARNLMTDTNLDLTNFIVDRASSGSLENNGILVRFDNEEEVANLKSKLSFYSKETHTVYAPYLEIQWNDANYSSSLPECPNIGGVFSSNLKGEYRWGDIARVDLVAKNMYPSRAWSTGSIYREQYILPESSTWGIKDEYTNEMVIDFNSGSTQISADDSGSFFILDTSNLEPERYYRLLVQVTQGQEQVTIDNKNIFRVGRNGKHV